MTLSHTAISLLEVSGAALAHELRLMRQAQQAWAARPVAARLVVVRRLRHALATRSAPFAATIPVGPQRSLADTLVAEVLPLADACRFLERQASRMLAPQRLGSRSRPAWLTGVRLEVHREPYGVVAVLGPANYPLFLPGVQTLQALVAGNAVLLKPGVGGFPAAQMLGQELVEAGLDAALLRVLPESREAAHAALTAGVDKVLLTGSARTGEMVLHTLAPHLIPATLELGGCDAVFVRADANLALVVAALTFGVRLNGGATCMAPRRIFVAHSHAAELAARLAAVVQALPPYPVAPAVVTRLQVLLDEACSRGATVLAGGCGPGAMVAPLVVTDARPEMGLLQEDLFAPVMALVAVQNDAAALHAAAACPYALGASIFGAEGPARGLAAQVRAGVVVINDMIVPTADPRLPFGGRGRSGFGRTRGAEGLLEMTVSKAIVIRTSRSHPHLQSPLPEDAALFQAYLLAAHGPSWTIRLQSGIALMRALLTRPRKRPLASAVPPGLG